MSPGARRVPLAASLVLGIACGSSDPAETSSSATGAGGGPGASVASSASAGGGGACTPGAVEGCYDGPAGTEGVGECVAGERTCQETGAFGACVGAVTPLAEVCGNGSDEDCDGAADEPDGGCVCRPLAVEPCPYAGPPGSEGVGICVAGTRTCAHDGSGWGACSGEVLPAPAEQCFDLVDDDCSGSAYDECGEHILSVGFDAPSGAYSDQDVAVAVNGDIVVAAVVESGGPIDLGGGPIADDAPGVDYAVVRLTASGAFVWGRRFEGGGASIQRVAVDVDATGAVVIAGSFGGTLDVDGVALDAGAGVTQAAFVAKLSGVDGSVTWAKRFGTGGQNAFRDVALDSAGAVLLTGSIEEPVDFGGGTLATAAQGDGDMTLVKLASDGGHVWSKVFAYDKDNDIEYGEALAIGSLDRVVMLAHGTGVLDFGGGVVSAASAVWVVGFDAAGVHTFSIAHPYVSGAALALDAADNVYVTGAGTNVFGTGACASTSCQFLAQLSPAGAVNWGELYDYAPFAGEASVRDIAVGADGAIYLTGDALDEVAYDGGSMPVPHMRDVFVAKLGADRQARWLRAFGANTNPEWGNALALTPTGDVAVTGYVDHHVDFGGGSLMVAASPFLLVLATTSQ